MRTLIALLMPRKPTRKTAAPHASTAISPPAAIPAAEALSFLRDTRGVSTWTARELADALKISVADAKRVIPILELQGYVKPAGSDAWMTTLAGEAVSGSKTPRYTRERIEQALADLRGRLAASNRDPRAPYKITEAVAFGDFLSGRPRVQAAEVGVELQPRGSANNDADSATEHKAQSAFLKELRGRGGILHVRPYEPWMSQRAHLKLL